MLKSIEAVFDGEVFRPAEEVELEANTRVQLLFETLPVGEADNVSFLELALQLDLDGPPDWSSRLDDYLYAFPDSDAQ
jgi:hypothetical protein